MILRRLQFLFAAMLLAAGTAFGSSDDLLPGSVLFYNHDLWNKAVRFGFDDNGGYTGQTRWYTANDDADCRTSLMVKRNESRGYLTVEADGDVHRSFNVLSPASEKKGPKATNGLKLASGSVYMDTIVTLSASTEPFERTDARDKLNFWLYVAEDGSVTNFMLTAGEIVASNTVAVTNYVIDAQIIPGSEHRLMLRAVGDAFPEMYSGLIGFEVYLDGERVTSGGTSLFPSAVAPSVDHGTYLHSLGLSGISTADRINFTHSDPVEDPTYYQDDVSMLTESAVITVDAFPGTAGALIDFPMLVRVSEENINGFYYNRCSHNGLDIRFTDENGLLIPHEIEAWNPGGESIFWVKVPYFRRGAKITMHWSLAPATTAPANDRYAVWSEYLGVWHFALDDRGRVSLEDSSGNDSNLRTVGEALTSDSESVIGLGAYAVASTNYVADFSALHPEFASAFTFTGWYQWPEGWQNSKKIAGKNDGGVYGTNVVGWSMVAQSTHQLRFYGDRGAFVESAAGLTDIRSEWGHVGFVYDGGSATAYANAVAGEAVPMAVTLVTNDMIVATAGLKFDELRLTKKTRSASWILAECMQVTNVDFLVYGAGNIKDRTNYWVVEPSANLSPPAVSAEYADTLVFSPGQARYGTPVQKFYDMAGNELAAQPTAVGTYKAVTTVADGVHEGLRHELAFVIFEQRAYQEITGHDRVMLFNSDITAAAPVGLQGYYDVDAATNTVWSHGDSDTDAEYYWNYTDFADFFPYVQNGVNHVYYQPNTGKSEVLWQFRNCRIGNLYLSCEGYTPGDEPPMEYGVNCLPWGDPGARRLTDSEKACDAPGHAGTLLLRNFSLPMMEAAEDEEFVAAAYSPLYTNGIETIYFDAVNVYYECVNQVKVQYCSFYDPNEPWYPGAGGWHDVPLDVFAITDGAYDAAMSTSQVVKATLAMDEPSATYKSFYRIRAHVGIATNVRFRIVRCDDSSSMEAGWDDPVGMIAIDNIIVSNPGMGVKISQFGAPDDPDNLTLRGQRAPFDVAFPTPDDLGSMHAQIKVDYIINNGMPIDTTFVGALTFRYRWRYLNQLVNEWRELTLAVDPDDPHRWVSRETIVGEGAGDIEYEATAIVNAPYYEYHDYSGLGVWTWPDGYSERYDNQYIDAELDGVYSESNLSPALGTDYFVRLRDGASEYEGFRVYLRRTNRQYPDGTLEVLDLDVSGDNTWRGFYNVETNGLTNVFYRVEAYNRQTATGVDYQWNTNYLHGVDQSELPAGDVWETGAADVWTRIPCDELTGRIMFQVDDTSFAVSIIHAEYQNFNAWSDAMLDSALFLGNSTEGGTSGVSRLVREYSSDFKGYKESSATDSAWTEAFDVTQPVSTEGPMAVNVPFDDATTPNGWGAQYGMWVCERYQELGGDSMALHLNARYGKLTMHGSYLPRGVESFSYAARTAQDYEEHPFVYYNLATNELFNLGGMTFAVPCSMCVTDVDNEFHGLGSVSAVIRYRDSIGGYEVRADRVGTNTVELSLYKWQGNTARLIGRSGATIAYTGETANSTAMGTTGLGDSRRLFGALLISATNTETSVQITAGILAEKGRRITASQSLDAGKFFLMRWEDTEDDRYLTGTVGVGSKECPAVFARPVYSATALPWTTSGAKESEPGVYYWETVTAVNLRQEQQILETADHYDYWNIYPERLQRKDVLEEEQGKRIDPKNIPGFKAQPLRQVIYVQGSLNGTGSWVTLATNVVESFNFTRFENVFRTCDTYLMQLKIGGTDGSAAVVIDEASLRQWRGDSYNTDDNEDNWKTRLFANRTYGSPTNFVFTTAWIAGDDGPIEFAPLRTSLDRVMSVRSPLMDGYSTRGIGLGAFSFRYSNADSHARLLVQINTNGVDSTSLADVTERVESGWETVKTVTFCDFSDEELADGLISCYLGLHGVTGVMRVIMDPTLITEANDAEINPGRDPSYGRVYITAVAAKDNPRLDSGSWWGWNLRTTDEAARQLLKDGDRDPRLHGLSYALNNSVTASTREGDIYVTHKPFLQTPILTRGSIGEVSFKARKYAAGDPAPSVAVYAMKNYDPAAKDGDFIFLTNIVVNCERYERFTFMAPVNDNYTAFRFAVTGVEGVEGDGTGDAGGPMPASGYVRRVMLDEVSVFEAIRARLGFRKVGAFRNRLGESGVVPNVPSSSEQPICNESWGVQAEVYAVRLSEKVDYDRAPKVYLHWFEGVVPWGYEKWKSNKAAHTAELLPAEEGSMVYRSNLLTCPDAVMPSAAKDNTTYQYMLEVVYYMQGQSTAMTNFLESSEWSTPEWYHPIDYNVSKGSNGQNFSAYTIIDSVPSGWAWINEINLFGLRQSGSNTDADNQYIEVAIPVEANINGWKLRMLTPPTSDNGKIVTNDFAVFGSTSYLGVTLKGTKDAKYAASNMVFLCVGSPKAIEAGKLSYEDGTLDGCWEKKSAGAMAKTGEIGYYQGLGFQLIRKSGIVEHELVAIGTNYYGDSNMYCPTTMIRRLKERMPETDFFYAGADESGKGKSLGVFDSHGETSNYWNNVMKETPGRINEFQNIDPDHPVPIGTFITVYFNLLGDHLFQTVGEGVHTNVSQTCVVRKGSAVGTNVVYDVDKWYELKEVNSSDGKVIWNYSPDTRHATIAAAVASSNNSITVTASAQVSKTLRDLGCDEQNRYTPAIINWLEQGKFLKDVYGLGDDWPDSDGNIYLADFMGINRQIISPMTLTQMYWLDICPTISNQCLVAGMATPPSTQIKEPYEGSAAVTNNRVSVFMMITNAVEAADSPYYGKAWAPYVLRGMEPGSHSLYYSKEKSASWTNETFKVTGILANGLTDEGNDNAWVPQGLYVFNENSFSNFVSTVEVPEPRSPRSLGWQFGWRDWWTKFPDDNSPVFFSWSLDTRSFPVSPQVLKARPE